MMKVIKDLRLNKRIMIKNVTDLRVEMLKSMMTKMVLSREEEVLEEKLLQTI